MRTLTTDPERGGDMQLERGQYRITARVPWHSDVAIHDRELPVGIAADGEFKRIYAYKLSAVPIDETAPGGEPLAQITIVAHVVDNPIPIAPIIWGVVYRAAPWIAGSIGGWFVIDKVERFSTQSLTGALLTSAAAVGGLLLLWNSFAGGK